jgi:hypothetical protein
MGGSSVIDPDKSSKKVKGKKGGKGKRYAFCLFLSDHDDLNFFRSSMTDDGAPRMTSTTDDAQPASPPTIQPLAAASIDNPPALTAAEDG